MLQTMPISETIFLKQSSEFQVTKSMELLLNVDGNLDRVDEMESLAECLKESIRRLTTSEVDPMLLRLDALDAVALERKVVMEKRCQSERVREEESTSVRVHVCSVIDIGSVQTTSEREGGDGGCKPRERGRMRCDRF